jgi:hypothetical protein
LAEKQEYSRIILIIVAVVAIVHALNLLLGVVLGLLAVDEVHALGLGQLVNLSASEADKELLGELMRNRLSYEVLKVTDLNREVLKTYPPCVVCPRTF